MIMNYLPPLNFLSFTSFRMAFCSVDIRTGFQVLWKHRHMDLDRKQRFRADCVLKRFSPNYVSPIDMHMVVPTVNNKKGFLVQCKQYPIGADVKERSTRYNNISRRQKF